MTQKLNKASRQVTVLQQENAELKEKGDISAKMMENNEAETEHFRWAIGWGVGVDLV